MFTYNIFLNFISLHLWRSEERGGGQGRGSEAKEQQMKAEEESGNYMT